MMEGHVRRIYRDLRYGFIRGHTKNGADYFFHKDDYDGNWTALCDDFDAKLTPKLEFEPTETEKGLRAKKVKVASGDSSYTTTY